ncbi:MAG: uracil-DNA glycosylase, partial [Pseudomonadota bacterium]
SAWTRGTGGTCARVGNTALGGSSGDGSSQTSDGGPARASHAPRQVTDGPAAIAGLRAWYDANDLAWELGPAPMDWFARAAMPPTPSPTLSPASAQRRAAASPAAGGRGPGQPAAPRGSTVPPRAVATSLDVAQADLNAGLASAATLADVRALLGEFEGCPLRLTAKSLCFYRGAERAPLLVLGEAPGANEDREGIPFIGRAGQLLDKMLSAIGIGPDGAHITNVVYWRPPGNRTPTTEEVEACRPFLARQIELVAPRVIMTVGKPASSQVLGTTEGIMKLRGRWRSATFGGQEIKVMPSLHPAYLLRNPGAKAMAWRDLCAVADALEG